MISELENKVRESDDLDNSIVDNAKVLSEKLGVNYNTCIIYLSANRRGFASYSEYHEHLAKKNGFASRSEYQKHLVKKNGFASYSEYREHLAKKNGFASNSEYQKHLAKKNGFASYFEYQEHLAKENGFASNSEYQKHLVKERGFASFSEYQESLEQQKFERDRIIYLSNKKFRNKGINNGEEESLELAKILYSLVDDLSEEDKLIINGRFFSNKTLIDLAKELGLKSRQAVNKRMKNILSRLRRKANSMDLAIYL